MKNKVLVVGSVAFDSVENAHGRAERVLGGAASYSSISASYFADPAIVAVVGTDFSAKDRAPFKKRGVNLDGLQVKEGKTFHWGGSYDKDLKNAVTKFTDLNVFQDFNPVLTPEQKEAKAVFLANIDPELQLSVLKQVKNPKLVACDTMNYWITSKRDAIIKVLKQTDLFFLNEAEARQLTGSMLVSKLGIVQFPPYILEHVYDTTGAGDTFGGGATGYLASLRKWDTLSAIKRAMMIGNVMASFAIESFSVKRLANIKEGEIEKRLKDYTSMLRF